MTHCQFNEWVHLVESRMSKNYPVHTTTLKQKLLKKKTFFLDPKQMISNHVRYQITPKNTLEINKD